MSKRVHNRIKANIRKFCGADDDQEAAELRKGGVFTSAFLHAVRDLSESGTPPTFIEILSSIQENMVQRKLSQRPVLSYSLEDQNPSDDMFSIVSKKSSNGKKRAVIIGINYTESGRPDLVLDGSHHDALSIRDFITETEGYAEDEIDLLMDDGIHTSPTSTNIYNALFDLVECCEAGDSAFIHFSGHVVQTPDENDDEVDGKDEVLVTLDLDQSIVDDYLYEHVLCNFKEGVDVTCLVDGCHSGSVFDLPYQIKL